MEGEETAAEESGVKEKGKDDRSSNDGKHLDYLRVCVPISFLQVFFFISEKGKTIFFFQKSKK